MLRVILPLLFPSSSFARRVENESVVFFTLRERDTVSRKKAKSFSVGIAVARRRNTMDSMYHLNAYDARSSLGKNRGSKGRTRCSLLYSYRLLDSSFVHVIYDNRWGKGRQMRDNSLTWKCSMMVHIKPRVSFGFPSTISSARILTSLIFL